MTEVVGAADADDDDEAAIVVDVTRFGDDVLGALCFLLGNMRCAIGAEGSKMSASSVGLEMDAAGPPARGESGCGSRNLEAELAVAVGVGCSWDCGLRAAMISGVRRLVRPEAGSPREEVRV